MTTANGSEPKGGASLFWGVYGQIAAMLGAFSILVFLTHFFDLGLKGVIREAFDGWVQYVRPIVGYPFQWLINLLPETWRFEFPAMARDYVAVGVVSVVSFLRAVRSSYDPNLDYPLPMAILVFAVFWPAAVLAYPLVLLANLSERIWSVGDAVLIAAWLAPLIYLGLLFAANAWLA